jgi:O-antigen ligase
MVQQLTDLNITWASLAYNKSSGLMAAIFLFSLLLYAITLKVLLNADRFLLHLVVYVFISLGLLEAIYGILQVTSPQIGVLWLTDLATGKGTARGTIIYKNQYASFLNMCWPLAIGAALMKFKAVKTALPREHGRRRKRSTIDKLNNETLQGFLFLLISSFIMMAVLFSESRGGIISMGLILVMMLILLPMNRKNKLRMAACLILLTMIYGSAVGFTSIIDRFMLIQGSGEARITIWLASLPMLYDHLLTGIGYGSYVLLSAVYLKNFPEHLLFDRAHNDYLELTIELGVPMALILFITLFTFIYIQTRRTLRYRKNRLTSLRSSKIIAIVALCAVTGFLFHGIADFGWRLPANLLYVITLIVLINNGMYQKQMVIHQ